MGPPPDARLSWRIDAVLTQLQRHLDALVKQCPVVLVLARKQVVDALSVLGGLLLLLLPLLRRRRLCVVGSKRGGADRAVRLRRSRGSSELSRSGKGM